MYSTRTLINAPTYVHTQAGVPLLFWQCANDVTPIDQAKRFYPLFAIFGNMAPIVSGQTTAYISKVRPSKQTPTTAGTDRLDCPHGESTTH